MSSGSLVAHSMTQIVNSHNPHFQARESKMFHPTLHLCTCHVADDQFGCWISFVRSNTHPMMVGTSKTIQQCGDLCKTKTKFSLDSSFFYETQKNELPHNQICKLFGSPEHTLAAISCGDFHQVVNCKNYRQREVTDHEKLHTQCYIQISSPHI